MRFLNKHIVAGYAVLSVAIVLGLFSLGKVFEQRLRQEINEVNTKACISGRESILIYNSFVLEQMESERAHLKLAIERGDVESAKIRVKALDAFADDLIKPVPSVESCYDPIL